MPTLAPTKAATPASTATATPQPLPIAIAVPTPSPQPPATPAPASTPEATLDPVDVTSEIKEFVLQDLTVREGQTIVWTNLGAFIHTTTAEDGLWDSAVLQSGETFSFTFTEVGTHLYFCDIHPDMTATVTVTANTGEEAY